MDNLSDWIKDESQNTGFWKPTKEGETLEGEIVGTANGNFGLQHIIKTVEGEEVTTPSHKILQRRLANKEIGQQIRIVYTGQLPPRVRGENPIQTYDVYTRKTPEIVGGQK